MYQKEKIQVTRLSANRKKEKAKAAKEVSSLTEH